MTHIAIQVHLDGKTADWMEKVNKLSGGKTHEVRNMAATRKLL